MRHGGLSTVCLNSKALEIAIEVNMDLNFISALNEGNELAQDVKKKGNSLFLQAIHNIASYFVVRNLA